MIVFPARTIESDTILFASAERRVINRDVHFEESDHLKLTSAALHPHRYPRPDEEETRFSVSDLNFTGGSYEQTPSLDRRR
jgi:hypothetical protein